MQWHRAPARRCVFYGRHRRRTFSVDTTSPTGARGEDRRTGNAETRRLGLELAQVATLSPMRSSSHLSCFPYIFHAIPLAREYKIAVPISKNRRVQVANKRVSTFDRIIDRNN